MSKVKNNASLSDRIDNCFDHLLQITLIIIFISIFVGIIHFLVVDHRKINNNKYLISEFSMSNGNIYNLYNPDINVSRGSLNTCDGNAKVVEKYVFISKNKNLNVMANEDFVISYGKEYILKNLDINTPKLKDIKVYDVKQGAIISYSIFKNDTRIWLVQYDFEGHLVRNIDEIYNDVDYVIVYLP